MIKIRPSAERGHSNHGWLDSYHTFSFADYRDPQRVGYRTLRVINEDRVKGGKGFGTHHHRNFEIVSYVVSGALKHEDTRGHAAVMRSGDIQRISAGTGIAHSEYCFSRSEPVHFLQIWILPVHRELLPGYAQESFADAPPNALTLACSADGRGGSIALNQDVDLFIGKLEDGWELFHLLEDRRYAWLQIVEGELELNGQKLSAGDGASVEQVSELRMTSRNGAHFLLLDMV
jgi:redox-sensitive bicupin YhaK (pirin superfamily)